MSRYFPRSSIRRALACAALSFLCASCGGGDSEPNSPPVFVSSGLTITPASLELTVGGSSPLTATVRDANGTVVPSAPVQWTSRNASVATVSATGAVSALAVGNAEIIATSGALADTAEVRVVPLPSGAFIEIHPEVTYQTIRGWEGTAYIGEIECNDTAFPLYQQEVLNRLVNELGINRVRIEVRSGDENPVDAWSQFKVHHNEQTWVNAVYTAVNDNNDPRVANPAGFQFSELDDKEAWILKGMRSLLAARGEKLYVNLVYVDFGQSAFEQSSDPEEYAELIVTTFTHLRDRFGWAPDALELVLEPDNSPNWASGQVLGRILVAAGDRLKAAGFRPDFIAPSTTSMGNAVPYLDAMLTVPRVLEYLTDFSYHRYIGVSAANLALIASRSAQYGLRTAMLEHIPSGHQDLHEDIKVGMNSAWQRIGLAGCGATGASYYYLDITTPTAPKVIARDATRYFRQYFSYVRFNAVRIGAVSGNPVLDPLAFRNTNNKLVVVVKADGQAAVQLRLLPAGTYGITYTTASQTFVALPDVAVSSAGTLQATMPAAGVMTIFQR